MNQSNKLKTTLAIIVIAIFALTVFGLIWFFFLGPNTPVGLGWYFFSFAAGLTMIVLPCTLPLAFVIVPLSMGKGAAKGLGIALAFGLGVALMLSAYGVIAAIIGEVAIGTLGAPLEVVKNWLYFVAGAFAFLFALGELGLINVRMPTYSGAAPALIQKQQDFIKAFLLGLFLGNVGVGCPHPATPVILTRIAASGDIFYGWLLFFTHAIGRILPLLLLAFLAILGVNALSWLIARKDKVERATGWGMVFVAGFILVLGLFSHDWWVASGQHSFLEEITGEEKFLGIIIDRFNFAGVPHTHGLPMGTGLFGLPLWLGNWVLVLLWITPLWWYYQKLKNKNEKLKIAGETEETRTEEKIRYWRFWFFAAVSLLLVITFVWYLPLRFLHRIETEENMPHNDSAMMEDAHENGHNTALLHEEADIREGLAVNLNITPMPVRVGAQARLDFFVNEKPDNTAVSSSALEIEHEKLMHVIGARNDLNEFFHIHPVITDIPSIFSVQHVFAKPGAYKIWSEIKKDGAAHSFGHPEFSVAGEGSAYEKEVIFNKAAILENYQVLIDYGEPVLGGAAEDITFEIHDSSGREVSMEPYLGADMHLAIIKDDLTQFIHTHPARSSTGDLHMMMQNSFSPVPRVFAHGEEEDAHEEGMLEADAHGIQFRVSFPEAGIYKMFAQFRPVGANLLPDDALTASFWIRVEEQKPFAASRGFLVAVSLALIAALSWIINKYLRVSPAEEKY
jgi:cytochrome c-type biogenesis protein